MSSTFITFFMKNTIKDMDLTADSVINVFNAMIDSEFIEVSDLDDDTRLELEVVIAEITHPSSRPIRIWQSCACALTLCKFLEDKGLLISNDSVVTLILEAMKLDFKVVEGRFIKEA